MSNIKLVHLTNSDSEAFWRRVNKQIKLKRINQEQVSSIIGVHYSTFRGWSHRRQYPRLEEIYLLAQVLETNINYLIFGTDTEPTIHTEYIVGKKVLDVVNLIKEAVNKPLN